MATPLISILIGTYQGEAYLAAQLDSLLAQHYEHWVAYVSDDGSTDETIRVVHNYVDRYPDQFRLLEEGGGRGFVGNFLGLVCDDRVQADLYAFCDQDDVWQPEKLVWAVEGLMSVPPGLPALYGGRALYMDSQGQTLGESRKLKRPLSFANALIENVISGNTMVFNQAARALVCRAGPDVAPIYHDWWLYLLVTACGGEAWFDDRLVVRYRQHAHNVVGRPLSRWAGDSGLRRLWSGQYSQWTDQNTRLLEVMVEHMGQQERRLLQSFGEVRGRSTMIGRLCGARRLSLYRQSFVGQLGYWLAMTLKRI